MTTRLESTKLRHLVRDSYITLGLGSTDADLLADTLVCADLWGHSSHGVMRTRWYGERLRTGAVRQFKAGSYHRYRPSFGTRWSGWDWPENHL